MKERLVNTSLVKNSEWVREHDPELYDTLLVQIQLQENTASVEAFEAGDYLIEYLFGENEIRYATGHDFQDLWVRDSWEDIPLGKIEMYLRESAEEGNKMKEMKELLKNGGVFAAEMLKDAKKIHVFISKPDEPPIHWNVDDTEDLIRAKNLALEISAGTMRVLFMYADGHTQAEDLCFY